MNAARSEILESFGRTLTVSAYADLFERDLEESKEPPMPKRAPKAGPGQDWFSVAPKGIPKDFWTAAVATCFLIEGWNRVELDVLFEANQKLDGHRRQPTLDSFGHNLAMECIGTGCGWSDDHPDTELELPYLEAHMSLGTHARSKLLVQGTALEQLFWNCGLQLFCDVSGPCYLSARSRTIPFKISRIP